MTTPTKFQRLITTAAETEAILGIGKLHADDVAIIVDDDTECQAQELLGDLGREAALAFGLTADDAIAVDMFVEAYVAKSFEIVCRMGGVS